MRIAGCRASPGSQQNAGVRWSRAAAYPRAVDRQLRSEHLLKYIEHSSECLRREVTETSHQSVTIHGANLIKHDITRLALESTWYWERLKMAPGREGGHDVGP